MVVTSKMLCQKLVPTQAAQEHLDSLCYVMSCSFIGCILNDSICFVFERRLVYFSIQRFSYKYNTTEMLTKLSFITGPRAEDVVH